MKFNHLILIAWLVTAFLAGCGQSRQLDDAGDERIVAFVAWLKRKGVTVEYLKYPEADVGRLTVTEPPTSTEYDVHFYQSE